MEKAGIAARKILDAAQKRMVRFGYRKVTMDEIAQDLGMSKNTIYRQFSGKEEVARALVRRLEEEINEGLVEIEKQEKDILKVFSASIALLRKRLGPWFEHFFREVPVELPQLWDEFARYRNEKILAVRGLVESGIQKKVLRRVHPAVAVEAYLGAVKAVVNPRFLEEEKLSFDQALEAVLDIWAQGILKKKKK